MSGSGWNSWMASRHAGRASEAQAQARWKASRAAYIERLTLQASNDPRVAKRLQRFKSFK